MRTILFSLGLLFLTGSSVAQQVAKSLNYKGTFVGFYEYKPTNYQQNKNKKYPLIIFLHGIGERGNGTTELPSLLLQGIPKNINQGKTMTFTVNGKTETFLVLSPQLPKHEGMWSNKYVDAMLDYAKKNLQVDEKRIFLTGLSLGGGGVWTYATTSKDHAKQFAAIAPVCGVCFYDLKQVEPTIGKADIGVWGFANMDDNIVSAWCTISPIEILSKNNSKKIKKTINQWGGHDAWTKAYDVSSSVNSPNLYEWFLSFGKDDDDDDDDDKENESQPLPANAPPVAKAGNDVTITFPINNVALTNAGSYDNDGNIQDWKWSKVSGPSDVFIASANSANAIANNLVPGTYVFRLTVTDNRNATSTDDVIVYVKPAANVAPVAKAGNDLTITLPTSTVTLANSGSFDTDGEIKSWNWSKVSGPDQFFIAAPDFGVTFVHNLVPGTYVFKLTITDNLNAIASDEVTVYVNAAPNAAPVAKAGNDISITLPVNNITLNNAGSFDSDGNIKGWNWTKVSGPSEYYIASAYNASTEITSLVEGTYVFRLTVTDDHGVTAADDVTVNVLPEVVKAKPPVANAGKDQKIPVGQSTMLRGDKSYAQAGWIKSFAWTKVSGPANYNMVTPNEENTWINSMVQGIYVYRLTVTDDKGNTSSDEVTIIMDGTLPIAFAGKDESISVGQETVLNGENSYVIGGSISSYTWTKVFGPANYEILTPGAKTTWIRKMQPGVYVYRLTIKDFSGNVASDDVVITVTANAIVADAGKDESIPLNQATVLIGDNSYVSGGNIKSYAWTKIAGPDIYDMLTPNGKSTWIRGMVTGVYVYRLTITDYNGNSAFDDVVITVNGSAAVRNGNTSNSQELLAAEFDPGSLLTGENLNVYPNPVVSTLNIRWSGIQKGNATLKIIDAGGKLVKSVNIKKEQLDFNTSVEVASLMPGMYMIQIQFANGKPLNKQFLKR